MKSLIIVSKGRLPVADSGFWFVLNNKRTKKNKVPNGVRVLIQNALA